MRIPVVSVLAALALVALPAAADAATFCVASPSDCTGTDQPNLQAALNAAAANGAGRDAIKVGVGLFHDGPYVNAVGSPVDIVGSGIGVTALSSNSTANGLILLDIREPTSTVSELRVHHTSAATPATGVKLAGKADDIFVTNAGAGFYDGVQMVGTAAELANSYVNVTHAANHLARAVFVVANADAEIIGSGLAGAVGVNASAGAVTVRRSSISATQGVTANNGDATVSDTQIQVPGAYSSNFQKVALAATGGGASAIDADRVTAFSDGTGYGLWAQPNDGAANTATVDVQGTVFDDFGTAIRGFAQNGAAAQIQIDFSAYNLTSSATTGSVALNVGSNNVDLVPLEPGFVTLPGQPRHLTHDSPLVDAGDPTFNPAGALDMLGRDRVHDKVDIGALEYQKAAPIAVAAAAPGTVAAGTPVSFSGTGSSDADPGETLTYAWKFDDGATATGAAATHAFAAPGTHVATLTVTDPTGRKGTDTVTVAVKAPATTPPPGGGGPDAPPPAAPLALTDLTLKPPKLRNKRPRGSRKRIGTTVSYRLSEAAVATFKVQRRATGRRVGSKCRKATRSNRSGRKCTRWVGVRGSIVRPSAAGPSSFRWNGKLARKALKPGRYRLAATARISDRAPAKIVRKTFRVIR